VAYLVYKISVMEIESFPPCSQIPLFILARVRRIPTPWYHFS